MANPIVAQPVKTLRLPRNQMAICPDCGAELVFLSHPRVTTCYCPKCNGGGLVTQAVDCLVTWRQAAGNG